MEINKNSLKKSASEFLVLANLAAITAIVINSGGKDLNLWVLLLAAVATNIIAQRDRAARLILEAKRSDVINLEETLDGLGRRLKQTERLAKAGLMASGIAHDLNNVLGVILGYVSILRGYRSLKVEATHDLDTLQKSVLLGQKILTNYRRSILYQDIPLVQCDLNDLIISVLAMAGQDLRRSVIQVRLNLAEELPCIMGDQVSLERLLLNLIMNAVKVMPNGGILTLTTEAEQIRDKTSAIRMTVEDTGPGIPAEVFPKLFKAFSTTRQTEGGTGLGLYLSASIAQQHGGMLCAENKDTGGARFTLYLPVSEESGGSPSTGEKQAAKVSKCDLSATR